LGSHVLHRGYKHPSPNTCADSSTYAWPNPDADTRGNTGTNSHSDIRANSSPHICTDSSTYAEPNPDADTRGNTRTNANPDICPNTSSHICADCEANTKNKLGVSSNPQGACARKM
jgi:hypothetical protein